MEAADYADRFGNGPGRFDKIRIKKWCFEIRLEKDRWHIKQMNLPSIARVVRGIGPRGRQTLYNIPIHREYLPHDPLLTLKMWERRWERRTREQIDENINNNKITIIRVDKAAYLIGENQEQWFLSEPTIIRTRGAKQWRDRELRKRIKGSILKRYDWMFFPTQACT